MEQTAAHQHIDRKFPGLVATIEVLVTRDEEFAELVEDYEQLSTWLALQDQSAKTSNDEIDSALELIRELENEIRNHLEKCNEHTC